MVFWFCVGILCGSLGATADAGGLATFALAVVVFTIIFSAIIVGVGSFGAFVRTFVGSQKFRGQFEGQRSPRFQSSGA
jgi:hypothetical protein